MLIIIDNSVCNVIDNCENNVLSSLENIAECIRSGKHIVLAERGTIKAIGKNFKLGELARLAFKNLYYKITEIGDIKNQVDAYILISTEVNSIKRIKEENKKIFKVPIDYFSKNERLLPSSLVAEDLSDCQFYEEMIRKYAGCKNYKYKLNFNYVNGGGLNTHLNYESSLIKIQNPCLVVVDSDKEYEDDSYGQTAANVIDKYNELKKEYITGYYILSVREKENLIPPNLYSLVCDDEDLKNDMVILNSIIKNNKLKRLFKYGDIKSGIRLVELTKDESNKDMIREYLQSEITNLIRKKQVDEELLNFISRKLDSVCGESVFGKVVKEIYDGKSNQYDINCLVEHGLSCIDEEKAKEVYLINGVNRLIKKIKERTLDFSINTKLKEKKELYSRYKTESLKNEVENLEKQIEIIDKFYEGLPFDLKEEWDRLSQACVTWGCSVEIMAVS